MRYILIAIMLLALVYVVVLVEANLQAMMINVFTDYKILTTKEYNEFVNSKCNRKTNDDSIPVVKFSADKTITKIK